VIDRGDLDPKLPAAWAFGFFAALFVVLGHFVYQVWCPELVKEQTPDGFAESQLSGFSADAPDRKELLTRATNALKEIGHQAPRRLHPNLVHRHGRAVWIPSQMQFFEEPGPDDPDPDDPEPAATHVISAGPGLMRVAIEEGARAEYELKALEKRTGAVLAIVLYAGAVALVAKLVWDQAWSVAGAAGWAG
jgi:hypothetical protein